MRLILGALALAASMAPFDGLRAAPSALEGQQPLNFSGKWAMQGGGGRGRGAAPTLTINQVGDAVTGELVGGGGGGGGGGGSAAPINNELYGGKVESGTLSFYVWRGTDKPYKVSYKGALNAAGDEITFTVTGAPGRGGAPPGPQSVVAKRMK